jgi:DNA-binding NarL/FixJ family response regulator
VRITLAEDSALLREGIAQLLIAEGHTVVDAVGAAPALLASIAQQAPELVIVDVRMPPDFVDEGIRAALQVRREHPAVAVLVLSQYVEKRHTSELLDGRGGVGYLLKDRVSDIAGFLDAIERVGSGGTAFDPEVIRQLLAGRRMPETGLTGREVAVLARLAQGLSNAAVAAELFISQSAVEKHINTIFTKLGLPPGASYNRRVLAVLEYLKQS